MPGGVWGVQGQDILIEARNKRQDEETVHLASLCFLGANKNCQPVFYPLPTTLSAGDKA